MSDSMLVGSRVLVDVKVGVEHQSHPGTVVHVAFTSVVDGGMVDDRLLVIVRLDSGAFRKCYLSQLQALR